MMCFNTISMYFAVLSIPCFSSIPLSMVEHANLFEANSQVSTLYPHDIHMIAPWLPIYRSFTDLGRFNASKAKWQGDELRSTCHGCGRSMYRLTAFGLEQTKRCRLSHAAMLRPGNSLCLLEMYIIIYRYNMMTI